MLFFFFRSSLRFIVRVTRETELNSRAIFNENTIPRALFSDEWQVINESRARVPWSIFGRRQASKRYSNVFWPDETVVGERERERRRRRRRRRRPRSRTTAQSTM